MSEPPESVERAWEAAQLRIETATIVETYIQCPHCHQWLSAQYKLPFLTLHKRESPIKEEPKDNAH